jgi:ribonuclease HI
LNVNFLSADHSQVYFMKQLSLFNTQESSPAGITWQLEVDGASRGNPGPSGVGIHILRDGNKYLRQGYFIGTRTNNQAEYEALLLGICILQPLVQEKDTIKIISDSELLVRQMLGKYEVKNDILRQLHGRIKELLYGLRIVFQHVDRAQNVIADALANEGIDKRIAVPEDLKIRCTLS